MQEPAIDLQFTPQISIVSQNNNNCKHEPVPYLKVSVRSNISNVPLDVGLNALINKKCLLLSALLPYQLLRHLAQIVVLISLFMTQPSQRT